MTTSDVAIVVATLLGPILAIQAQKWIERARERKTRQRALFYALMATRAARMSPQHVHALNMIDIEFHRVGKIVSAWKEYRDHLNNHPERDVLRDDDEEQVDIDPDTVARRVDWQSRGDELFASLLAEMSTYLQFDFDKSDLKRAVYTPRGQLIQELSELAIRDGWVRILTRKEHFGVALASTPEQTQEWSEIRTLLRDYLRLQLKKD